jgi:hypothetical protein
MDLLSKHKLLRHIERASGALGLPTSEPEMRTSIIKMILATDMIFHYELQENLANLLEIIHSDHNNEEQQQDQGRPSPHKPSLPSTTEENESEGEEQQYEEHQGGRCNHDGPTIIVSKSSSTSTESLVTPTTAEEEGENSQITNEVEKYNDDNYEEEEEEDVQVKDIFSTEGAKSAISFFRRKSYFEEDMIPLCLKSMPVLPASPEEDEEENKEDQEFFNSRSENHHTSGVDLVTSTIQVNGVDKIVYTPPNYIMEPQQRLILCQIVLHAADISNALRPWPICRRWSNLVCEEFFEQGEAEQENGLKVSPNMDRNSVSQTTISLRFGDFVVSPYFEIVAALFPKADELLKQLAENRKQWLKLEEEEKVPADEDDQDSQRLPSSMLPDRPILNPSGRRVSVAAGMVIIPDELEERTIGSGKNKRKYWGFRSVSHSGISDVHKKAKKQQEKGKNKRRKSEEPTHIIMSRNKLSSIGSPLSPIRKRSGSRDRRQQQPTTLLSTSSSPLAQE